jgi:hypothetical protein
MHRGDPAPTTRSISCGHGEYIRDEEEMRALKGGKHQRSSLRIIWRLEKEIEAARRRNCNFPEGEHQHRFHPFEMVNSAAIYLRGVDNLAGWPDRLQTGVPQIFSKLA